MKIYNNEINCQRGESFQINRRVINGDGTPYIVPLALNNPYLRLTIASVSNNQSNRYCKSWWVPLNPDRSITTSDDIDDYLEAGYIPRFTQSNAVDLRLFTTTSGGSTKKYTTWSSVPNNAAITGWIGSEQFVYNITSILTDSDTYYDDCVFCAPETEGGKLVYKYFCKKRTGTLQNPNFVGEWKEYNFDISFPMTHSDTSELVSQKYLYSINLLAGSSTEELFINSDFTFNSIDVFESLYGKGLDYLKTYPEYYNALKDDPDLMNALVDGIPLTDIDFIQPILKPTSLTVNSNLKGGI